MSTLFSKIIAGEIPAKKVYEDEFTFAFHDISPQAPVHVLVVPKKEIINVSHAEIADSEILGRVLLAAKEVAKLTGIEKTGYRIVFNNGQQAGQTVFHMHCHVLGGRSFTWPPG
jgi:histidine triad (HIT) family protein